MDQFPGNSHTSRIVDPAKTETADGAPEPKKLEKVVTGKARKKPLGSRFKEMFISDGRSFAEHLVESVVVPMIKDMALSIVTQIGDGLKQGFEEMIWGEGKGPRSSQHTIGGVQRVNYTRYSASPSSRRDPRTAPPRAVRRSNVVEDVILDSREDGQLVKEELEAIIDSVGHCTVGDLYTLVDIPARTTDEEWGWTDLRMARVQRVSPTEFLLQMPRPQPIETGRR